MSATQLLAERLRQLRTSGQFCASCPDPLPSPCVSVCRMTADRSHCEGCFRSIDEIRAWSGADAGQRRAIWAALLARAGLAVPEELKA